MSSRVSIQQFISNYDPAGTAIGDEWNNPLTGKLYKRTLISGVVSWADITPLQPSTLFVGTTGNISVGYAADQGYKLSVNGTINSTGALTQAGSQVLTLAGGTIAGALCVAGTLTAATCLNTLLDTCLNTVAVGKGAGCVATNNIAGTAALVSNTTGCNNTAVGYTSLYYNSTGVSNTAVGFQSLKNNTFGGNNTAVGNNALFCNTTGTCNTAIGMCALYNANSTGTNLAVGYCAGVSLTTGVNNTVIGSLPAAAGCVCTLLIGAGTCERIRVDDTGLYVNNTLVQTGTAITSVGTIGTGTWCSAIGAVNGTNITNLNAANLSGTLSSSVTSSSLTAVGTITTGTWCSAIGAVNGTNITNLNAGNLSGTLSSTVTSSSLTQVGTITTGTWAGAITTTSHTSLTAVGTITTGTWCSAIGAVNGTNITNLNAGNLSGTLSSTVTSSSLTQVGTITTGTWSGSIGAINGNSITNLNAANLSGTLSSTVTSSSLTTVGTLTSLAVTGDTTIGGNLTVNGTTTTINSNTLTVDDKNLELGSVPNATVSTTGTVGSITGASSPWTATITGMSSTTGLIIGSAISAINGAPGSLGAGGAAVVASIVSSTSITYTYTGGTTPVAGSVTTITTTGATEVTADGGGLTLKGTSDKTFNWVASTCSWTSSECINIASGKAYYINGGSVLTANVLGSTVTSSSLTAVGTITTGTWCSAIGAVNGTNITNLNAANLSGTLSSSVTSSSLTTVGTITTGTWSGSISAETYSTSATVTAGTNTQGQGALTSDYNIITTTAANPSGVTLPVATIGRRIIVVNKGTNPLAVFPATGGTIDLLTINTAITIPVNGWMEFNASSTTQWYSSYNISIPTNVSSFSAGTTGLTPNSATTGAVTLAGTLAVANGGTGQTTTGAAFNSIMGYATTVSSASPIVLTKASGYLQFVTGSTAQVITLPDVTTLTLGWSYGITNNNTANNITINSSGGNLVYTLIPGISVIITCILITGTTAASWNYEDGGAIITNDIATSTNIYPLCAAATSGSALTVYTSNTKYLYKPSTGELSSPEVIATNGLVLNSATISASYTVAAGTNAMSVGPITVNSGAAVTVSAGQRWVIL